VINPSKPSSTTERANLDHRESGSVELLPHVLDALPVGIALFAVRGDQFAVEYANHEFGRVLRRERPFRGGELVTEVFERRDRVPIIGLFQLVRSTREPKSYFAPAGTDAADSIWSIDAYPVRDAGRVTHILVLAEQTRGKLEALQRQQFEANRLRQRADHLAELEKAKSEFLRLASHELRGPAAMLGGYLAMIEDGSLGPIPEGLRPVLPVLKAKASQINILANEMVEAARLEDGRLQLKRKRIDFAELVRRSLKAAQATATRRHRISFEERDGPDFRIIGDGMRLEIVVGNLLDNAIKYSPAGGEIRVELSRSADQVMLSVRDHGIGIAPEDMSRLFVRFSRLAPPADVPGTGLGLYLARELARLHGGDILAHSTLGQGTKFTLTLPVEPVKN
jgi:signal transduction histidine kinase